jgi:NAD(P)-dependent dehydrogenase (short-subunit alcohol dehydrogenase family)
MRLTGKTALITGASSGIGKEAAILFAREKANVVLGDINESAAEILAKELTDNGAEAFACHLDVTDSDSVAKAVESCMKKYGELNVAFNCAGIFPADDGGLLDTPIDTWNRVLDVNLKGIWLCNRSEVSAMLASGGGSIVNVASFVALMGAATAQVAYTASKGGVLALTREIAVEYARQGIRANSICPGPIETPLLKDLLRQESQRQKRLVHIPMGRFGKAAEIAKAALFLASDDSSFMTGAALIVDGGITAAYVTPE